MKYDIGVDGQPAEIGDSTLAPLKWGLPDITWIPGFSFWWERTEEDQVLLCILAQAPSAKAIDIPTGGNRPVWWRFVCPLPFDPLWLYDQVLAGIQQHERAEWLTINGEALFDPHDHESNFYRWGPLRQAKARGE